MKECPKCGAEVIKDFVSVIEFSCRSHIAHGAGFVQTTICERKCELTKLKSDVERLRAALGPFASIPVSPLFSDGAHISWLKPKLTAGHLRNAARALEETR